MEDSQPSPSRNLVHAGNSTTYIPLDLTVEILSRLPAKPLIRFQSVSKLWFSIIRSKDFTDSFLTRSRTRPRLVFTIRDYDPENYFIFSAPEHQNNDKTVVARHDMTISDLVYYIRSRPINGFFVCCTLGSSIAVCNPTTRQMLKLPDVEPNGRDIKARLGYDPVEDEYKVLCVMMFDGFGNNRDIQQEHFVSTVRSGQEEEWRKIEITQGETYRTVYGGKKCIHGAIYYGVGDAGIARFDVRSEKMELIQGPKESHISTTFFPTLLNYNGKLGGVAYDFRQEMRLWILEDAEKQEWSKVKFALTYSQWKVLRGNDYVVIKGGIHPWFQSTQSFSVCYYEFNKERIRKVEIQGIADDDFRRLHRINGESTRQKISSYPGHVENIMLL